MLCDVATATLNEPMVTKGRKNIVENPVDRPMAAKLIDLVIREHNEQVQRDILSGEFRAGYSLSMKIYVALKKAGYLKEEISDNLEGH